MSALAANPVYAALLNQVLPRIIRSEEQNDSYLEILYEMEQRKTSWSPEEAEVADLLTLLIEDYESKHYGLPRSSPVDAIEFLMDQHGWTQEDLLDVFGDAEAFSEVMRGERELKKDEIRLLSERFAVSPEMFF